MRIDPGEESFDPAELEQGGGERLFGEGLRLFDAGEYHAAHEALEKLWLGTQGAESDLFKGLIQACIAMHHFERGNLEGARKLYSGHRRLLAAYLPECRGVDLTAFLGEMQRVLGPVARGARDAAFETASRPRITRRT